MIPTVEAPPRARPRDRKQRIAAAAAEAFAARGYHQVSMSEVAGAVGISAPALYRHFPNKYALFVHAAFLTAHRLIDDTDDLAARTPADAAEARQLLDALLRAAIRTTIDSRAAGGIYRWEGRYLEREDRIRLTAEFATLRDRVTGPHSVLRPDLPEVERDVIVWSALATVASITSHRTQLGIGALTDLLVDAAWRVLDAELPPVTGEPLAARESSGADRRRDRLVDEAIRMFATRGYHDVSIEEIATAVDLTASGVYRHFAGKSGILLAACERAAERMDAGLVAVRAASATLSPREAVRALALDYVRRSSENHDLMRVYYADFGALAPDEQRHLRVLQRSYLADWVELLRAARPELGEREATFLVHAGFGVVADLGIVEHQRRLNLEAQTALVLERVLGV